MQKKKKERKPTFGSNSCTVPSLTSAQAVEVRAQHAVGVNLDDKKEVRLWGRLLGGFSQVLIHWGVGPHHLSVWTGAYEAAGDCEHSGYFIL